MRALCVLALAAMLAGCGVSTPDFKGVTVPSASAASGDAATFIVDGQTILVRQSGRISTSIGGVPQLTYSGPLGCRGRFFTAHLTEHIDMLFRYTSRDAYLLIGNGDLYHFVTKPRGRHGQLSWDHQFEDRHITVLVDCPPPPRTGPLSDLDR